MLTSMPWATGVTTTGSWPYLYRASCLQPPYLSFLPTYFFIFAVSKTRQWPWNQQMLYPPFSTQCDLFSSSTSTSDCTDLYLQYSPRHLSQDLTADSTTSPVHSCREKASKGQGEKLDREMKIGYTVKLLLKWKDKVQWVRWVLSCLRLVCCFSAVW